MNLSSEFFEHFQTVTKKIPPFFVYADTKRNFFVAQNTNQDTDDCDLSRFFCANFRFFRFRFAPYDEKSSFFVILVQKALQMSGTAGVTELAERFCFDLTDTLAGNIELATHFLQGAGTAVIQAETKLDNVCFTFGQGAQLAFDHLAQNS